MNNLANYKLKNHENKGLTYNEIIKATGIKGGGGLTTVLEELTQCGFIMPIYPINKTKEDCLYRLMDEYVLYKINFNLTQQQ